MSNTEGTGFPLASQIGWTCPVCESYNERENLRCDGCGFVRAIDHPMDDDLQEDSGPLEP